jgi:hypothetical protein
MILVTLLILFIVLQVSLTAHIYNIIIYVLKKETRNFRWFLYTLVSNMVLALVLIILAVIEPKLIRSINFTILTWVLSGLIMLVTLAVQINIAVIIIKRSRNPENYHYNYFGKKVLHAKVVRYEEILIFIFTMFFLLFAGAYFVARLINLIIYGQL